MATTPRRVASDNPSTPVPFSYAQAAKGLSSSAGKSGAQPTKSNSGSVTPSKEPLMTPASLSSGNSAAGDVEQSVAGQAGVVQPSSNPEQPSPQPVEQPPFEPEPPQMHALQTVELTQQSDVSAKPTQVNGDGSPTVHNIPSLESGWDEKSEASTAVEKSHEHAEERPESGKKEDLEKEAASQQNLQEAPVPTVNVWKQRAQELKAKAAMQMPPQKSAVKPSVAPSMDSPSKGDEKSSPNAKTDMRRKANSVPTLPVESEAFFNLNKDRRRGMEQDVKGPEFGKTNQPRRSSKFPAENEGDQHQRSGRQTSTSKPFEKEEKPKPITAPPVVRDDESWPTPDTAQDEEKRRAQEKGEKAEKEKGGQTSRPHGRNEWKPVPYTPSVIFNTPLPTGNPRRGGRGGGRGGRDSGRGGTPGMNGSAGGENTSPDLRTPSGGDQGRRGRSDGRAPSPARTKRAASAGSVAWKESRTSGAGEDRTGKDHPPGDSESQSFRSGARDDIGSGYNSFPRHFQPGRQKPYRKQDNGGGFDRRREGEGIPPRSDSRSPKSSRRASVATQVDGEHASPPTSALSLIGASLLAENARRRSSTAAEGNNPTARPGAFDRRGDNRSLDMIPHRERWDGRGRGSVRGRGGAHAYGNSHHASNHYFQNSNIPNIANATYPTSKPSAIYQQSGSSFAQAPPPSRVMRGGGQRPHSIVGDTGYGRQQAPFAGAPLNITPIQTYSVAAYDQAAMPPLSAATFPSVVDPYSLAAMVAMQLEYYFSVDNLCKDMFLRKHMDSQGFVLLKFIADFNRIKQLTTDMELLKYVCYSSPKLEYRLGGDGKDRLRRKEGWEQWVLTAGERDPTVQNDGPVELHNPPVPYPQLYDFPPVLRQPASASAALPPYTNSSFNDVSYQPPNGSAPANAQAGVGSSSLETSGDAQDIVSPSVVSSTSVISSTVGNGTKASVRSSDHSVNAEEDTFSDKQIETLSVIVRKYDHSPAHVPLHSAASRSFSNGSIDGTSMVENMTPTAGRNEHSQVNGFPPPQLEDYRSVPDERVGQGPVHADRRSQGHPVGLYWVKHSEAPVDEIPADATYESYTHLRLKALEQRQNAGPGACPYDMDILYQFWSHFLVRNFNCGMYNEFRRLAIEDQSQKASDVGMRNLIKFYGESLRSQNLIRERIAQDYVDLVKAEEPKSERPALRQLRSAWRNGALNLKNRKLVGAYVDADLRESLEQ